MWGYTVHNSLVVMWGYTVHNSLVVMWGYTVHNSLVVMWGYTVHNSLVVMWGYTVHNHLLRAEYKEESWVWFVGYKLRSQIISQSKRMTQLQPKCASTNQQTSSISIFRTLQRRQQSIQHHENSMYAGQPKQSQGRYSTSVRLRNEELSLSRSFVI